MSALPHPFFQGLSATLHIAHRGGAALAPENTLEAFEMAVRKYRTDMLELDVHLSRDGEVVVCHDETVDRCTDGTGPVSQMTWDELQRLDAGFRFSTDSGSTFPFRGKGCRLPSLRELLQRFPEMKLNIDLKSRDDKLVSTFAAVVREEGAAERICCGAEWDDVAERLHRALPECCHFYPMQALTALVMAAKTGQPLPSDARYCVLDMPLVYKGFRLVDARFVSQMTDINKWVNVWTIDAPEDMRALIADGVGGIMTDRSDLLRAELDAARSATQE